MDDQTMQWHPIACIFPMLHDDELQRLAEDIREQGQREPIVLFDGKVLDGRNRYLACKMASVIPTQIHFKGSDQDALNFVWSTNSKCSRIVAESVRKSRCEMTSELKQNPVPHEHVAARGGRCCDCHHSYQKYECVFRVNGRTLCESCASRYVKDYNGKWVRKNA